MPEAVIDAIAGYYRTANANTHGEFATSRESDRLLHETREAVTDAANPAGVRRPDG